LKSRLRVKLPRNPRAVPLHGSALRSARHLSVEHSPWNPRTILQALYVCVRPAEEFQGDNSWLLQARARTRHRNPNPWQRYPLSQSNRGAKRSASDCSSRHASLLCLCFWAGMQRDVQNATSDSHTPWRASIVSAFLLYPLDTNGNACTLPHLRNSLASKTTRMGGNFRKHEAPRQRCACPYRL